MRISNRRRLAWVLVFAIVMGCFANGGGVKAEGDSGNNKGGYLWIEGDSTVVEFTEDNSVNLCGELAVTGSAVSGSAVKLNGIFFVIGGNEEAKKGDVIDNTNVINNILDNRTEFEKKIFYEAKLEQKGARYVLKINVNKDSYDGANNDELKENLNIYYYEESKKLCYLGQFNTKSTSTPTQIPTQSPTEEPTSTPTPIPTQSPTEKPTSMPTLIPTNTPTEKPTTMYKITYELDGGTMPSTYPRQYETGKELSETEMPVPRKDGYLFGGWYSGNTRYAGIAASVSGDLKLTAKWYAITLICDTKNGYAAVGEALSLSADIDRTIKDHCRFVWEHEGEEREGAKVSFDVSGTGEQVYYCTVSYGIYSQSVKITVIGYNAKIKITLYKTKSTKDIFGKEVSLEAVSLVKKKDKKYVTLNKKKGTIKIKKFIKSTKINLTVKGQKLTVTVSIQLPVPKVKAKKGKVTSYVEGKYRRFKLIYSNIKGADRIVSYYSKKKNKGYKKGSIRQNKKKGASVSIPKGSKYYFKVVAYYGKAKSPQSKVVVLKG